MESKEFNFLVSTGGWWALRKVSVHQLPVEEHWPFLWPFLGSPHFLHVGAFLGPSPPVFVGDEFWSSCSSASDKKSMKSIQLKTNTHTLGFWLNRFSLHCAKFTISNNVSYTWLINYWALINMFLMVYWNNTSCEILIISTIHSI